MKATSIFGGVQVFNIVVQLIRLKVVALLLGPAGLGIIGLFTSAVTLITNLTNFGLGTSAVRDISEAYASKQEIQVAKKAHVLNRLVRVTGLFGLCVIFFLAPFLSRYSFGNDDFTTAFRWLSISLLLNQLTVGQTVLLQGMRQLKLLAKANVFGSVLGLLVSLPLYYIYDINGIVAAIIISSALSLVSSLFYARHLNENLIRVSNVNISAEGKSMLKMGILLSMSGLITVSASYFLRAYIGRIGSLEDVGLYSAGYAIIGGYVGVIFTAMSTDYYPRLSAVASNAKNANLLISQQAEIALLIIGPILCLFLIFANGAVVLLYSVEFVTISGMIQWAALGMYFKAASWAIGYLFLATGASRVFFLSELIANSYILLFNICGYNLYGLDGLGVSFLISYILYLLQVYLIARRQFNFSFVGNFFNIIGVQIVFGVLCFLCDLWITSPWSYFLGIILLLLCSIYSYREMDKRLKIKEIISKYLKK